MDLKTIETDWRKREFSCDLWVDPPGQVWNNFVHRTDELVLVVEGALEVEMQGKVLHSVIGKEIFIPAGVVHSVRNVGGTTARWLYGYKQLPS